MSVPPRDFAIVPNTPFREPGRPPSEYPPPMPSAMPVQFPTTFRLLDDVQLMEVPDPDWLVDGVIPRRGVAVVYGQSGSFKTTICAGLLTAVATGDDWFGHKVRHRGASVCVAAEDVSGFKVRVGAAKRAKRLPMTEAIGVYTFPEPIDLRDHVSVSQFIAYMKDSGGVFECVVVDTYAAATPGAAENSSEDTTLAMTHAQQIRDELQVTVILVHHTNAGGTKERGHSAMRGAADAMIQITPVDDVVRVECSKQRNGPMFEALELRKVLVPGGGCVLRAAHEVLVAGTLSEQQRKALAVLRDTFTSEGASKTEWLRACGDIPERSFHRAAKVLQEDRHFVNVYGSHFRITSAGLAALSA